MDVEAFSSDFCFSRSFNSYRATIRAGTGAISQSLSNSSKLPQRSRLYIFEWGLRSIHVYFVALPDGFEALMIHGGKTLCLWIQDLLSNN